MEAFTLPSTAYALYPATRRRRFISGSPKQPMRTPRTLPEPQIPLRRLMPAAGSGGVEGACGAMASGGCHGGGGSDEVMLISRGNCLLGQAVQG